ncbi:DNA polymerase delta subunit POL32 ASCRUDRAFT_81407 [Ascoidea rubescens DSM 1968]|uniref:DNA polymerase delta subunit 3 n=1 Tax=Ascoidea rubescens DSM 1968 TaxID=1344418 RepID=A0A1D2VG15_9ASCO|nr:hypothetical protein ASCRUDRAFT_81407 [Ascoidea rubescens DSM 1968]ODV60460.1 hypothetical protein ASCRUDRAFT_81407 [Ascoidea rubescens DSM 1968]
MDIKIQLYLQETIFNNKQPISYRWLTREFSIHSLKAKRALASFYESHKNKLKPTFIIIGYPSDLLSQSNSTLISVIEFDDTDNSNIISEKLNERKSKFQKIISLEVYSLCLLHSKINLNQIISGAEAKLSNLAFSSDTKYNYNDSNLELWGVIKGSHLTDSIHDTLNNNKNVNKASNAEISTKTINNEKKQNIPSFNTGLSSNYVSRKLEKKPLHSITPDTDIRSTKRFKTDSSINNGLNMNKSKVNTSIDNVNRSSVRSKTENPPQKYVYVSRKQETKKPKEKVIVSNITESGDESDGFEEIGTSINKNFSKGLTKMQEESLKQRKELETLFNDDNDEEMVDPDLDAFSLENKNKNKNKLEKDINNKSMNDDTEMIEIDVDNELSVEKINKSSFDNKSGSKVKLFAESELFSKQRNISGEPETIIKKEPQMSNFVDEDGYLVTQVDKSSKTTKAKPKLQSRPKAKNSVNDAISNSKKGKQSSIMNFFGTR